MSMISRRTVLTLPAALAVAGLPLPAIASRRDPYVLKGEMVDSIIWHLWDDPRNPAPAGGVFVEHVHPWDGVGYPVVLAQHGSPGRGRTFHACFYDFEWSNLRRDVPSGFWGMPGNSDRYPNVHAYVREQRFGEHPDVMRQRMAANDLLRRQSAA